MKSYMAGLTEARLPAEELRRAIQEGMGKSCGFRIGRFVLRLRWLPRKPE